MICFDECQQLEADNVFYALSRLRSTRVDYQLKAVATCNPDPASFLMDFVKFSLDENLIPIRQDEYKKRYFFRGQDGIVWYDSLEEAEAIHGASKESGIKSFLFVPGSIVDNPDGLRQNEGYVATLKALPRCESDRLLKGAWVKEQKSGFFNRSWVKFEPYPNLQAKLRTRCWDLAFSEVSEARPKVDATAGVLMSKDKNSVFTVEDCVVLRSRVREVEQTIFDTAERDGRDVIIGLPKDPGATAGAYCQDLARQLIDKGFTVKLIRPEKGKLQRFLPFACAAEAGLVRIVKNDWTEAYLDELEQTEFSNKTFDDRADATSDCFYILNRQQNLPLFSLPNFTSSSPVSQLTYGATLPSSGLSIPQSLA